MGFYKIKKRYNPFTYHKMRVIIKFIFLINFVKAYVMKRTTSLCFSKDGLINPESIKYLSNKDIDTVVLFSDGSKDAYDYMRNFDFTSIINKVSYIGVGKTPLYEMRVIHPDSTLSKPHYVYSEDVRTKWICSKICAHHIKVNISDITSQSKTQVHLDHIQTELMCYLAYKLWVALKAAEDRLCFPAVVIDKMTRWTYSLTPETIDIKLLRKEVGLKSLDYNSVTDLLSVSLGEDIFSVKLSVLNAFYTECILPLFNAIYGRRLRIQISFRGSEGQLCDSVDISYGELGRIVEEMHVYAREKKISSDTPIDPEDLLAFAKKVKIDEESCLWPTHNQSIKNFIETNQNMFMRDNDNHHQSSDESLETESA